VFSHPKLELEHTGVVLAEADMQQAFVDILAKDVIKPLENLKVSREDLIVAGIPVLMVG
jgi:hypothetical protein